ncbi:MAG: peptidase MA family metallohydrolase [Candidatus Marinimicrobia bacterium]|nr:peptidase MA family metallohydrolase [Candidatus Neomarinimicrobiota bacterium]
MKRKLFTLIWLFTFLAAAPRQEMQQGKVRVYFAEKDRHIAVIAVKAAAGQQERLTDRYGLSVRNMHIYIAENAQQYSQLSGTSSPVWSAGLASHDRMLVKSPSFSRQTLAEFRRTLRHETVHLAVSGLELPVWFNEGFAQYESEDFSLNHKVLLSRAVWQKGFIPFREIEHLTRMQKRDAELAYAQSLAAVSYLVGQYGPELLAKCLYFTKKYAHFSTGFRNAYLMPPEAFERQWREEAEKRYRFYIILDMRGAFWMLITLLFLLGYLLFRLRQHRLLKNGNKRRRKRAYGLTKRTERRNMNRNKVLTGFAQLLAAVTAFAALPAQVSNFAYPAYWGMAHSGGAVEAVGNAYWLNPALPAYDAPYSLHLHEAFLPGTGIYISEFSGHYRFADKHVLISGLNFENYGSFEAFDSEGIPEGEFTASQYQYFLGYAYRLSPHFRAGIQAVVQGNRIKASREYAGFLRYGFTYAFGERENMPAFSGVTDGLEHRWRASFSHELEYLPVRLNLDLRGYDGDGTPAAFPRS